MAVAMKVTLNGAELLEAQLRKLGRAGGVAVEEGMALAANVVKARVQDNMGGKILTSRTGNLSGRILIDVDRKGLDSSALIGTDVNYGPAHEFGAQISNGFGKGIAITLRPRRWLSRSLDESEAKILAVMRQAITAAIRRFTA